MPLAFHNKPGLVAYLTCGDPDLETSRDIVLAAISAGADVVELGIPFSDPVADGPVIQRASERALRKGTTLGAILRMAAEVRRHSQAGLVIFSYLNPVLQFGMERFCETAAQAGIDGVLLVDMTIEEAESYIGFMRAAKLATIFLAAPTSTDKRLQKIAKSSRGFVYAVSRTGVTGVQQQVAGDAEQLVSRLRKFTRLPVAVGFGLSSAAQLREVGKFADAAVVGSAIVETIERCRSAAEAPGAVADLIATLLGSSPESPG